MNSLIFNFLLFALIRCESKVFTESYFKANETLNESMGEEIRAIEVNDNNESDYEENGYFLYEKEEKDMTFLDFISNELKIDEKQNQNLTSDQKFLDSFVKVEKILKVLLKKMTPIIMDRIYTINISSECMSGLFKTFEAISNNQEWVFKSKSLLILKFCISKKRIYFL
jgi:hypothetical protein